MEQAPAGLPVVWARLTCSHTCAPTPHVAAQRRSCMGGRCRREGGRVSSQQPRPGAGEERMRSVPGLACQRQSWAWPCCCLGRRLGEVVAGMRQCYAGPASCPGNAAPLAASPANPLGGGAGVSGHHAHVCALPAAGTGGTGLASAQPGPSWRLPQPTCTTGWSGAWRTQSRAAPRRPHSARAPPPPASPQGRRRCRGACGQAERQGGKERKNALLAV